jgi:cyclohexanone monooxygenase
VSEYRDYRIAVIGAGPAGIGAGHELLQQGFSDFVIFDSLDAPGGTWRLHTYPGLACDVWAHSYTFTYAPNPDWSASFVDQPEIQSYLARCATEFGLDPHLRLNTRIDAVRYQEDGSWLLTTQSGETHSFDVIINALGNQHTPLYPDVPGIDSFAGDSWHGTRWNHDVNLSGKRVAVVGSAANAIQVVPEVAKLADHLYVLQRSANWVMPRGKKTYSATTQRLFRTFPGTMKLLRRMQMLMMGQVLHAVTLGHSRMGQFENMVRKYIKKSINDSSLHEALTPDTRYGCKRGLVSDDFYPAFNRDNVELLSSGLAQVNAKGFKTTDGRDVEVDVIIYCTGYRILDFDRIEVTGIDGLSLADAMGDDPQAYKGIAVPDFPNYFLAVGPNGLALNVSYFITMENNVRTIVGLMSDLRKQGGTSLNVRSELCEQYNNWMSGEFAQFSWGAADCSSYYRNASGHAPFLFPGSFKEFSRLHDESGLHEYHVIP